MMMHIDVTVFLYKENGPLPLRQERLRECAHRYSRWRGLTAGDFTLAVAPGGKPYFPRCPQVHFSISHSAGYWAAAFSGRPLGLDIQRHVERDYLALAKRWYHPLEYTAVEQFGPKCFFDIWSAKESLVKCNGTGFPASFPSFSVVEKGAIAPESVGWQLKPLNMLAGYSACVCGKELGQVFYCQSLRQPYYLA